MGRVGGWTIYLGLALTGSQACTPYAYRSRDLERQHSDLEQKVTTTPQFAVLLIDMQEYFTQTIDTDELEEEIPHQMAVLGHARANDVPVAVIEYEGYGRTINPLEANARRAPRHRKFNKSFDDAFTNPELAKQLRSWDVDHVFLMGAYASDCVYQTGQGALSYGFDIATSRSVIADMDGESKDESVLLYARDGLYDDDYRGFLPLLR